MHVEIIIMTKYPTPGGVKTRLIGSLSPESAADLYERCIRLTFNVAAPLMGDQTRVVVAGAPDDADFSRLLPPGFECRPQGEGDLGARIGRAMNRAFAGGASRAIVIGCDCPDLQTSTLQDALGALEAPDAAVIGPAADGGYYLLGIRRPVPGLFEGIDWSTERVCSQTVERFHDGGCHVHTLPRLSDLDEPEDLVRFADSAPTGRLADELRAHVRTLIGRGSRP